MPSGRPMAFIKIQDIREAQEWKDLKNGIWKGWSEFKISMSSPYQLHDKLSFSD